MAKGKKRTPEEISEILTAYATTNNLIETSKLTGIPVGTIKSIVDRYKDTDDFKKLQKEKKELFSEKANRVIDKAMELLERRFDTALSNEDTIEGLINIVMTDDSHDERMSYQERLAIAKKLGRLQINGLSEITTSLGTLYDKMRLDKGESTTNNTITVQMSDEVKELSK